MPESDFLQTLHRRVKVIIVVLIEGSEGPLVPWCQSGQPCNMTVMQILLRSSVQNDGTSFWLLEKAQLVEWGNLILLHPRFKSYDLNQKGLRFVSRSQITLIKLKFSHVSSRKFYPVLQRGFHILFALFLVQRPASIQVRFRMWLSR